MITKIRCYVLSLITLTFDFESSILEVYRLVEMNIDDNTNINDNNDEFSSNSSNDNIDLGSTMLINSNITKNQENNVNSDNYNRSKRSRRLAGFGDSTVEDIMGQICNKMSSLTTSDQSNNLNNEDKVIAFIQVLQCAYDEAYFYLESSAWDTETAVILWLDNHYNNDRDRISSIHNHVMNSNNNNNNDSNNDNNNFDFHNKINKYNSFIKPLEYEPKQVYIEGLDPKWIARVSQNSGKIYFTHIDTGVQQYCVPPGFADKMTVSNVNDNINFNNSNANDDAIDNVSILTDANDVISHKSENRRDENNNDIMEAERDTYSPNSY